MGPLRQLAHLDLRAPADLSVIVPAYREGPRIHDNLLHLLRELDATGVDYEVVVVSDGNTDDTVSEAERVASPRVQVLAYQVNEGKGFALMHGIAHTGGALIAFIDADMELDPSAIGGFVKLQRSGGWDVVVGSKRHPESQVAYPAARRLQSWIYQQLVRVLFRLDVTDTQTGIKLFRGDLLRAVVPLLAVKRFAFDLELLVVARKLGYRRIVEAPIKLDYRFETTTSPAAAYRALWDTAAIFYRLNVTHYYDRRLEALLAEHPGLAADVSEPADAERP
jgi:glycosyltransferase involved in cell wall biosynthesis